MDHKTERELMRLLHGELSEAATKRLQQRLQQESALQDAYQRLQRQWQGLELPAPEAAPPGFAIRVVTRARGRADEDGLPIWWSRTLAGRVATAAVLAGGIALGAMLALPRETEAWTDYVTTEPTMAESYLAALEEPELELWEEDRP